MPIHIDFDNFAEGARRALGAAAADIDERGYATRGEVGRICGENYQWARHRLDQLRDAGILSQSATMLDDGSTVEKRYTLEEDHRETAETVREALAITGGDLDDEPGADAFYDVVDEVRALKSKIDDIEAGGSTGDGADGSDLETRIEDLNNRIEILANATDEVHGAVSVLADTGDMTTTDALKSRLKRAKSYVSTATSDHTLTRDDDY